MCNVPKGIRGAIAQRCWCCQMKGDRRKVRVQGDEGRSPGFSACVWQNSSP
ncbi:hypothetical protein HNI00_21000 [Thermoleptolyngbya oregonensis NK1-22]|uniref:Uncharacterized protein n=1 Tax=Thermoleptolyngbya oregonensis NK1-22 TaxID=2547457 RepID=A0AA96Y6S0_9CYAN|nr:hypothetical protein [Thermoleptolyngbya oregonensis]WOB45331.1 hypothetical protein HNI00_21000 [Thermoleptolyngbya oregonensis NK1-22]